MEATISPHLERHSFLKGPDSLKLEGQLFQYVWLLVNGYVDDLVHVGIWSIHFEIVLQDIELLDVLVKYVLKLGYTLSFNVTSTPLGNTLSITFWQSLSKKSSLRFFYYIGQLLF